MNKRDVIRVVARANQPIDGSTDKAYFAAEALHHQRKHGGDCFIPLDYAAALLRWQALLFNGQWEPHEYQSTLDWLKTAIIVDTAESVPESSPVKQSILTLENTLRINYQARLEQEGRVGLLEI